MFQTVLGDSLTSPTNEIESDLIAYQPYLYRLADEAKSKQRWINDEQQSKSVDLIENSGDAGAVEGDTSTLLEEQRGVVQWYGIRLGDARVVGRDQLRWWVSAKIVGGDGEE